MDVRTIPRALALFLIPAIPSLCLGAGFAFNENFMVLAPDQPLANQVLARADAFRKQVAEEWFGEELPPGAGAATIHVRLSDAEDIGFTWAIDSPRRRFHKVWLETPRSAATGATLHHEVVHVVFATRFPSRLPAWIEEGIAGLVDGRERVAARRRVIERYLASGNAPDFERVFASPTIPADDQVAYSVAVSVTEYLLSRGDKARLLRFALSGSEEGWERALRQHYGLGGLHDLEPAWHAWASRPSRLYASRQSPEGRRTPAVRRTRSGSPGA